MAEKCKGNHVYIEDTSPLENVFTSHVIADCMCKSVVVLQSCPDAIPSLADPCRPPRTGCAAYCTLCQT